MSKSVDLATRLAYAVAWVRGKTDLQPVVGLVLGSGLGAFADGLADKTVVPYDEIPGFPISRVAGHAGRLVLGDLVTPGEPPITLVTMQGRVHAYEGWPASEVAFGTRVLMALGVKSLVVTNAAGGINPGYGAGDLVRITDQINLTGQNPLTGPNDDHLGPRFPDMTEAYDRRLGGLLDEAARQVGVTLKQGVYAGLLGPSYETPAEIRMLKALGADLVGMSTVHEVIVARHQGVPVVGLSVVTNLGSGMGGAQLTHQEVQETAGRVRGQLERLLTAFLGRAAR
jgi:purine-nucleoside phosphorylase